MKKQPSVDNLNSSTSNQNANVLQQSASFGASFLDDEMNMSMASYNSNIFEQKFKGLDSIS